MSVCESVWARKEKQPSYGHINSTENKWGETLLLIQRGLFLVGWMLFLIFNRLRSNCPVQGSKITFYIEHCPFFSLISTHDKSLNVPTKQSDSRKYTWEKQYRGNKRKATQVWQSERPNLCKITTKKIITGGTLKNRQRINYNKVRKVFSCFSDPGDKTHKKTDRTGGTTK